VYARAVFISSVAAVLVFLFAFRFVGFSRTLFMIDGLLLLLFVSGSRIAFRLFRTLLPSQHHMGDKRAVIYGAGDRGELLYRELINNRELGFVPVAFIDDDSRKSGKVLHGLRIFDSTSNDLIQLFDDDGADEIVVSSSKVSDERLENLIRICPPRIPIRRMQIELVPVLRATLPPREAGDNQRSYVIAAERMWPLHSITKEVKDVPPGAESSPHSNGMSAGRRIRH
jgi:FlaA1/EpsC-like NDP-sugar epimerase